MASINDFAIIMPQQGNMIENYLPGHLKIR
jgi:hypothetical protein